MHPEAEFQLRVVLRSLYRRKFLIVALGLLGAITGLVISKVSTKMYSSTATIELNRQSGSTLGLNDLSGVASQLGAGSELNVDLLTQQKAIETETVALSVIQHLNLWNEAPYAPSSRGGSKAATGLSFEQVPRERERVVAIFRSRLTVAPIKDSRLTSITFMDSNPERAAEIANAVVEAYTTSYTQARYTASSKASSWLADQLSDLKQRVLDSQKRVSEYRQRVGIVGGAEETGRGVGVSALADNVAVSRFVELNRDLTAAEVARIAKDAIYRLTDTRNPDVVLGVASSQLGSTAGSSSVLAPGSQDVGLLSSLRQQRSQFGLQEASQSDTFGAKSPEMIKLRTEITELEAQIRAELMRIHERAGSELRLAQETESGLRRSIAAQQQEIAALSSGANQLVLLEQEANSSRILYQDLYAKLEEANVAAGIKASNITIIDPARVAASPSVPKTSRNTVSGLAIGVLLGIFITFLLDMLKDQVVKPEQAEMVGGVPVIGVIPIARGKRSGYIRHPTRTEPQPTSGSPSSMLDDSTSAFAEAFRTLRSSILLSRAQQAPKRILFTSSLSGDGKTTTCANTAIAFALQGSKVLLIEADMRRPALAAQLGVKTEVGLAQYLASEMPLSDVIISDSRVSNLFLLPCGTPPPMPAELLGSKRFSELMEKTARDFDFVMIDSPPLLLVGDALTLSSVADATIVVLRYNRTTEPMLRQVMSKLRAVSAANLTLLLNGFDARSEGGYYYKDDRYYGYSPKP